jgi:hypothetical protein
MAENTILIETSFAQAIDIIMSSAELSEQKRRHWTTSLRQIGKALDRPLEVIPARYSAVRADLRGLHHAPLGLTPKTLQNHRSNVKSALLWLAHEKGVPQYGAPLTPEWEALRSQIGNALIRMRLSALMRFCSVNEIGPTEVDEIAIDRFMDYRAKLGKSHGASDRRLIARAWNKSAKIVRGWPARQLLVPPAKSVVEVPWEAFPEGLRRDVEQYLDGLTRVRRGRNRQRIKPLRPLTIETRRRELIGAARMAVKAGVPIETLTSLAALLAADVAEKILDAYWTINGDIPTAYTIDLACHFLAIASETKCLGETDLERLGELRRALEEHRSGGLTDKNLALIRQVLTPGVWNRVLRLPAAMMATARLHRENAPVRSAVAAQLAVAIAILSVAPVRLANLTAIRLGFNLVKPGGPASTYRLLFPDYDVKNRVKLDYPLPRCVTHLVDEYVHEHRPVLLRGRNEDWLFPGETGGHKGKITLSGQVTERISEATGLRITVHQFRHAAGALILRERPGEYELVRLLLGHRSVQTTMNAYVGLESIQASEIFSEIVMKRLSENLEAAE